MKPASLPDASRLLAERAGEARPFMGGTDLFVRIRDGFIRPQTMVDVKHLPGMRGIVFDEQAGLTVGAATTMNEIAQHPAVQAHYPLLAEAAGSVATYQLRNRATLGGNLCNGSPAADTAPAALVLEGRFVLYGLAGEREVPAVDFFLGPGKTAMQAGELMTAVRFQPPRTGGAGKYLKLGRSKAGDLSIVGVAVVGFPDGATSSGYTFRIALASVAPVPLRALEAEEVLAARPLGEETLALAAEKTMEAATPIDDVRASAVYRKAMVRALTLRGLQGVWAELAGQEE
ncbi:MAG: xanthine dehydrogenase family protein subunit M [Chloroflexi bacterium]|nr:xanthine dehydrogenase family protein subunit M [Chloroflexota bacterium]MBU1750998.1 xanthine dehydrogenase family protein subunit M [Chloroflexota bacterium]